MEWKPIEEIIPKEIPKGHGGASSDPVLLTNGKYVWAGDVGLMDGMRGPYLTWDVHGVDGRDYEPAFEGATHYMPLPAPYKAAAKIVADALTADLERSFDERFGKKPGEA